MLYTTDGIAIAVLCSSLVLFSGKAEAAIENAGRFLTSPRNPKSGLTTMKKNPAVGIRSDTLSSISAPFWQCFGLDPASRALSRHRDKASEGDSALDAILHISDDEIVY